MHTQREISDQLSLIVGNMTRIQNLLDRFTRTNTGLEGARGGTDASRLGVDPDLNHPRLGKATWERLFAQTQRLSEDTLVEQSNSVQTPSRMAFQHQCRALCSCVCHTRNIVRSPCILDTIVGKINVQYTGRRPSCNEFHCRRPSESSFKVVYQLPKYIASRYVSMVMHYSHLNGPELLLRVPRIVSWSHPLWNYITNGDLLAIQKLFAEGKASPYDLNARGSGALFYTGNRNHSRTIRFLLEQGVDLDHPNVIERTPSDLLWEYFFAGRSGSEDTCVVGSRIRDSGHVQTRGFSTLHKIILGILHKDLETELATSTAAINAGDSKNMTPLCWATIRNDLQAVKTLLAFGANPNVADKWGRTPLYFARSINVCKTLLHAGENVHLPRMTYGRSALHQGLKITGRWYLESDTVDTIDILVNAGIDINVRDQDGETPLLSAVRLGHTFHTRRMLELGANPNACNQSSRHSAIHFAVLLDHHDAIPLLLQRGADYTALDASGMNIAHMAAWFAGTKTISVLAESNLINLDTSLRCKDGKTPADYLSERNIYTKSEQGLHAEFERFIRSIPVSCSIHAAHGLLQAGAVHESYEACDDLHLPGAYPVFPGSNISF